MRGCTVQVLEMASGTSYQKQSCFLEQVWMYGISGSLQESLTELSSVNMSHAMQMLDWLWLMGSCGHFCRHVHSRRSQVQESCFLGKY